MEWISVKDRYPILDNNGESDEVLCITCKYGDYENREITYEILWYNEDGTWQSMKDDNFENNGDYYQVTHWMEIPKINKK